MTAQSSISASFNNSIDCSFSFCFISSSVQNRVLLERLSHMEAQLKVSEEDGFRLRMDRDRLRERASELQTTLKEKQAEVSDCLQPACRDELLP